MLKSQGLNTAVGDEGGFAPDLPSNEAALDTIAEAIEKAGLQAGRGHLLGLDVASSEFYRRRRLHAGVRGQTFRRRPALPTTLRGLADGYPIISIEDGMAEDDWDWLGAAERDARQTRAARR